MTDPVPKNQGWSSLNKHILFKIADRLNAVDHIRFRSVCSSWRASSPMRPNIPLIVTCTLSYSRRHLPSFVFHDLVRNENIDVLPPNLVSGYYKYIGCSHGWIFLASINHMNRTVIISLLNPFTGEKVTLPEMDEVNISTIISPRLVLSLPVVVYYPLHSTELRFIRFGEPTWKRIQVSSPLKGVTAFNGRFYGHYYGKNRGKLYLIDLEANNGNGAFVPVQLHLPYMLSGQTLAWGFLVEFSDDLLVAFSSLKRGHKYEFMKVDFENGLLQMLPEIGGHMLFLGDSLPVFVPPERLLDFRPDGCRFPENSHVLSVNDSYQLGHLLSLNGNLMDPGRHRVAAGWITPVLKKACE